MNEPRFEIGTKFKRYSRKHAKVETIVDIIRLINSKGELVGVHYVTEQEVLGQTVVDNNVGDSVIARSLLAQGEKLPE